MSAGATVTNIYSPMSLQTIDKRRLSTLNIQKDIKQATEVQFVPRLVQFYFNVIRERIIGQGATVIDNILLTMHARIKTKAVLSSGSFFFLFLFSVEEIASRIS